MMSILLCCRVSSFIRLLEITRCRWLVLKLLLVEGDESQINEGINTKCSASVITIKKVKTSPNISVVCFTSTQFNRVINAMRTVIVAALIAGASAFGTFMFVERTGGFNC